jgi:hypothetical protein
MTHILAAKGLDGGDRLLAKSVAERLISCAADAGEARENRDCGERGRGDDAPL